MYVIPQQGEGVAYAVHVPSTFPPLRVALDGGTVLLMIDQIMYAATRFEVEPPGHVRLMSPKP